MTPPAKPALDPDERLTTTEAGKHLGFSDETIRRMCEAGELPASRRPGGQWRLRRGDLDAWLESTRPIIRRKRDPR